MDTIKNNKDKILKICKFLFIILVIYFLSKFLIKNIGDVKKEHFEMNWPIFIGSIFLYFIYMITLASLWHYITYLNGCSVKYTDAVVSYLYSILGKYIPGKVFMLAARLPAYEKQGVQLSKVTVCFFIENGCTILGSAFIFLISLFFFPNKLLGDYSYLIVIGLMIAFFICIHPKIINWGLRIIGKIFKKDNLEIPMTYSQMLKVVLLFILNWLIVGAGFYLLVRSIYPVPINKALYCAGMYGVSVMLGILVIFTVSGLGVRETIIIAGLMLIMPKGYAGIVSVVSRLWATIAELILIVIAFIFTRIMKLQKK